MAKDTILYDRLNINSNSTQSEIKKSYRKLSLKWHPDKNNDNKEEATKKFQEISEAYSILSDPEKRKVSSLALLCGTFPVLITGLGQYFLE